MEYKVSYQCAIFFIGITMILLAISESHYQDDSDSLQTEPRIHEMDEPIQKSEKTGSPAALSILLSSQEFRKIPKESLYSNYRRSSLKSPKSQGSAKCPALRKTLVLELRHILSPDIISQSDPFYYLVDSVMKISVENVSVVSQDLDKQLVYNRLPKCYIPFARVLASLLKCEGRGVLRSIVRIIQEFQQPSSPNNEFSFLRSYIDSSTSPELFQLSSEDIFNDPRPPMRLLHKLLDMPKSSIRNLQMQVKNLLEMKSNVIRVFLPRNEYLYISYIEDLLRLLQTESALDDLKYDVAQIQKTSTSNAHLPATSVDSTAKQVLDEIVVN